MPSLPNVFGFLILRTKITNYRARDKSKLINFVKTAFWSSERNNQ